MSIAITPCQSSNIKGHGYDAATQTLAIKFAGGTVWHYAGVSPDIYNQLTAAPSVGSFFSSQIRNKFRGEQQKAQG